MMNAAYYRKIPKGLQGDIDDRFAVWSDDIHELLDKVDAWQRLSNLQDRLLACYRIGKNPGSLIEKLEKARARAEKL